MARTGLSGKALQPASETSSQAAVQRFIAHLDMDAFYASVELLRYPALKGLPLVIGGRRRGGTEAEIPALRDYAGRGVIPCTLM